MSDLEKSFQLGFTLEKIDMARRRVCGTIAIERPDKQGEIMDYATAKPNFEKWSGEISKNTNGNSQGNLRVMHTKQAAGKLVELTFNDLEKSISCVAEIHDEDVWAKCMAGVYSGFSMGGKYQKMWKDAEGHQRYTPIPLEVSLVDNPGIPGTTFQLMKDGGEVEMRKFAAYEDAPKAEPTEEELQKAAADKLAAEDAAKGEVRQVWLDVEKGEHLSKAAAIKETVRIKARRKAEELIAPAQKALDEMKSDLEKVADGEAVTDPAKEEKAAVAEPEVEKAATVTADPPKPAEAITDIAALEKAIKGYPLAKDRAAEKTKLRDLAKTLGAEDKLPELWGHFSHLGLKKGMFEVSRLAELVAGLDCLLNSVRWEEYYEGESSSNPGNLKAVLESAAKALKEMVVEEVGELTATDPAGMGPTMAYAALLPKDKALMLSKYAENEMLKGALVNSIGPGDTVTAPSPDMEKMAAALEQVTAEKDALEKIASTLAPQLEEFRSRLANIESQPQRPKGVVRAVEKGAALEQVTVQGPSGPTQKDLEKMSGEERGVHLMKLALSNPIKI